MLTLVQSALSSISGMFALATLVICGITAFFMSFTCYGIIKPPIGLRILHALTATSLNFIYVGYYLFGRFMLGWTC